MLLHSPQLFSGKRQQKCNPKQSDGSDHFDSEINQIKPLIQNIWVCPYPLDDSRYCDDGYAGPFDVSEPPNGAGQKALTLRLGQDVEGWPQDHSRIKQSAE